MLRARNWLIGLQADEGEGYSEGDLYYGGIGYGGDERPDLSNLQMALEALDAGGLDKGDAAFKRALSVMASLCARPHAPRSPHAHSAQPTRGGVGRAPVVRQMRAPLARRACCAAQNMLG
mgnify:CR=1 FL=1